MTSPLQRSPSGDVFSGDNPHAGAPGDTFARWNPHTREWEPATIPSGGAGAPLSSVWYVDAGTLTPLGDQDGSIGMPYSDLQSAVTARGTGTYLLTPGGYGDLTVPLNESVSLVGLVAGGISGSLAVVGNLTTDANVALAVRDLEAGTVNLGEGSVLFAASSFSLGDVTGGDTVALWGTSTIRNNPNNSVGNVTTNTFTSLGCVVGSLDTTSDAVLQNSSFANGETVTVGGDLYVDLLTLNNLRSSAIVPTVTGTNHVLDAPTLDLVCNIDSVAGAPTVQFKTLSFPGARPGDTFAVAPRTAPLNNIAFASPSCVTNDEIQQPVIILAGATPTSLNINVTRFTVGDVA